MNDEISELFAQASELEGADRVRFVDAATARDPRTGAALRRLLQSTSAASPLDRSPWKGWVEASESPALPERIGPFRILRELGRGGMGRVFLAEEESEAFSRQVALKVLDRPLEDADAVRRFRDEVRILSMLEHPGIARFLDGGRLPDGLWFLALEYVDGDDLLTWAEANSRSVEDRVRLFRSVLDPVAFAHDHRIVHRDLKPTHLLIDRLGHPRLLDFGISKLLDPDEGGAVDSTRTESRALTPAYAAPEQFRGETATPATDVFALGAVLYELLCGRRPFAGSSRSSAELERAVAHLDPEPPSVVAERSRAQRGAEPATRTGMRGLGRDLDAIALKALRKLPSDRYADAGELARDIDAWLAGLPVGARRGGMRYRFGKALRRRRFEVALALALVVATAAATFGVRAHRAALRARSPILQTLPSSIHDRSPASDVEREFALQPANPALGARLVEALVREGRTPEAEVALGRVRQLSSAADEPRVDYAEGVLALSRGETQRALAVWTSALRQAESQGRDDLVPKFRLAKARAHSDLGQFEISRAEMLRGLREATAARDETSRAVALNDLGVAKLVEGKFRAGEWLLRQALAAGRNAGDPLRIALTEHNLGGLEFERGRPDLAVESFRATAAAYRELGRERRAASAEAELARALHDIGATSEAAEVLAGAISTLRRVDDRRLLSPAYFQKACRAIEREDFDGALALAGSIATLARDSGTASHLALVDEIHGRVAKARGEFGSARAHFAAARSVHRQANDFIAGFEVALLEAEIDLGSGRAAAVAERIEAELAQLPSQEVDSNSRYLGDLMLARAEAGSGRTDAAAARLERRRAEGETSPSVSRRLAYFTAAFEVATALGDAPFAERAARAVEEIERRIERSPLDAVPVLP